jgi:hypothetical protein
MLHDISRGDKMRIKRIRPNAGDAIPIEFRMAHDTISVNYSDESDTLGSGLVFKRGKMEIKDLSGNTVTRGGFDDTDADNKFKVAKPGQTL